MTVDPGSGAPMADRMQSMLSRAVEDQRSEQRQLAGVLSEMRDALGRMGAELEAVRRVGGSDSSDDAVATLSRDMREGVRLLAERLDAVGRSVQERGADLAEVKVMLADLHGAVRGHTSALGGVSQALAAVPAVGERVGGLHDNLVQLHDRLVGLEELSATVDRLALRIESADQDMRELRSAFSGMAARLAELPGRPDLDAAAAQSREPLDVVASRLARIETAIPELLSRVDHLRERLDEEPAPVDAPPPVVEADDETLARLDAIESALMVLSEQLTADAAEPDEPEVVEDDPVAVRLDELLARLDDAGADDGDLDARISAAVTASEQRVTAHVDEAVIALAEALFRTTKRPGRPAPVAEEPEPEPEPDEEPEPEDVVEEPPAEPPAWQIPTPQEPPAAEAPEPERRRPWWRPGD